MSTKITSRSRVELGVVPTHLKFVGGLIPGDDGRWQRNSDGSLVLLAGLERLLRDSRVPFQAAQIPYFTGTNRQDIDELIHGIRSLGLTPQLILMVSGGDPMNPGEEDAFVGPFVEALSAAKAHGIEHVSSTSLEVWMQAGASRKEGPDFEAAVAQLARAHTRTFRDAGLNDSCIKAWHIEFLRKGEFQTFTDIRRAWTAISAMNDALEQPFFKVLVDAAHCGDSGLSIAENQQVVQEIADADALGVFHASAKTTRGCFSTDDGWISAMLSACAATGKLEFVFVECFHHEDEALVGLRELDSGHGINTLDGRTYDEIVCDGLADIGRRLNNLVARGVLQGR